MTIIGKARRGAAVAATMAFFACGFVQPVHAVPFMYHVLDWISGGSAFDPPSSNLPVEWSLGDGETLSDLIGAKPEHYWGKAATCLMNYPYKGTWPGPFSGAQWDAWQKRNAQDQTMFLAGAFVREGAWLDSISTQCAVVEPDGSWEDPKPLEPTATGLDGGGKPMTEYQALLYAVIADTGYWKPDERTGQTSSSGKTLVYPDVWQAGGSPFAATCPKNSYVYGFNAAIAIDKNAIARVGIHCVNPLTGATSYSGMRQVNNSDGTSNGMLYRLYPTESQLDGVFCPQGQLATGFGGYLDTGNLIAKSTDHITGLALVCHPYSFNRASGFAQVGYDRPGSDIDRVDLSVADPKACEAECGKNGECQAWTYVFHNVRDKTQCFLKKPSPVAVKDTCCISGVKPPLGAEVGQDRPGANYYHSEIYSADPNLCADFCMGDASCRSWTYVKPGVQADNAVCWFKNAVPDLFADRCCISGLKNPLFGPKSGASDTTNISKLKPPSPNDTLADAREKGGDVVILPGIPKAATPAPGVMFGGTWLSTVQNGTMYTLKLSQNADGTVVGGYEAGTISDGVIVGNQLYAHWQQGSATGTLLFTIAPDNAAFSGTWTTGDLLPTAANADGTWDGYNTAVFTGVPGGDDFTGTWTVTQSEGESYEMTLAQSGDAVTGTYDPADRAGTVTGHDGVDGMVLPHLVFDPAKTPGDGWTQSGGSGSGWFYLYPDKTHLSGIWRMADNTNGAWSAVRKDAVVASVPDPVPAPAPAPEPVQVPNGACPGPNATVTQNAIVHVGLGAPIPGGVTLAGGAGVSCIACDRSWCLIASAELAGSASAQSPTVSRKLLDFGDGVAEAPKAPKVPKTGGTGNPPPPPSANFAGDWTAVSGRDNCYEWHLDQQGVTVTGTYNPLNATITGTVSGSQLHFDWTEHDANMQPTTSGSGMVTLASLNSFGGDWWSPPAADEPAGNNLGNTWHATRRLGGQPDCVAGGGVNAPSAGGEFDLSKSRIGKLGKQSGDAPAVDVGGSANDNAPPPPPVIR